MNSISMLPFAIGQLGACAAFLLLAYSAFLLSERQPSTEAKIAAIGFAYSGVGIFAQLIGMVSAQMFADSGLGGMWNSFWFNLLVTFPRPWVMLVVAICLFRLVQRIPDTRATVEN